MSEMIEDGALRVWWIPQVPMQPFEVDVDTPAEAKKLLGILARYDAFQFENNVKPDYCNVGGLNVWQGGEWVDWYCPETGADIDEWEQTND